MEWISPIDRLPKNEGGGKAAGLALLKRLGKNIPATWIITTFDSEALTSFIASLPPDKTWAVRSSAAGEDSAAASFAGQYITYLHVKGEEQILKSIRQCFASARSERANTYKKHMKTGKTGMHVILQEMIVPKVSGVLFTVDPVSNRHDKISLSMVTGTADQLMSGTREGETLLFYKQRWNQNKSRFIPPESFRQLVREALEIEERYGQPVDLEWVFDNNGFLYWLQLRPVTGLDTVHMNELDHKPRYPNPIYTRGNIGEMMPGPVTPLTLSTFGKAIDRGLQVFYKKAGVLSSLSEEYIFVHSYYNHLFFDINALYQMAKRVWLTSRENVDFSVIGELVPNVEVKPDIPLWKRMMNFIRVTMYMLHGPKAVVLLRKLESRFRLDCPDDPRDCYRLISENMQVLFDAYDLHYISSSQSGGYFTSILNIYSGGKPPLPEHYEKVARLFTNIPDIESVQVLHAMDALAETLANIPRIRRDFLEAPVDEAIRYLSSKAPDNIRKAWAAFLQRHGHRCVREAEMREKEWARDPAPVVEGLKGKIALLLEGKTILRNVDKENYNFREDHKLSRFKKLLIRWLLPRARKSVARREQTKALAILVQYRFKVAYQHLAKLLVNAGLLQDPDLIFFLTHRELGHLLEGAGIKECEKIAGKRRSLFKEMQQFSFPDLTFGIPVPEESKILSPDAGNLTGIPVSRGIAEGKVRLVHSLSEARSLQEGEIMVSKYTDIGWTPFYSIISGMITEIGSPLSHGAVVAREYNLPALVSVKGAMNQLRTGQLIRLDAIKGKVKILN